MPLVRFKIRNELSLGGPALNRSATVEDEEPKAILGAVEVAGLVGILRQLGDLAEFSAEVFNGIQEEVTVTASRCQRLTSRVKRIELALSPLEKAVLSQTSHLHFAYTAGCEWHPRIRNGQRHFVQSDLPLFVMETYEQCRDPPPLHLLDRFDLGGPGSCLRKYSDPTFFRKELNNSSKADDVKVQRDQAHRKRKKKRLPQRNICRSRAVSTSDETNGARLSSLTDDRHSTSQSTSTVDMPRSSNMQDLSDTVDQSYLQGQSDIQGQSEAQVQSGFPESSKAARDSITGPGYIEYVINGSPANKPDVKLLEGFLSSSLHPADRIGSAVPEGCIEVVDDNILHSPSEDIPVTCASIGCNEKKETHELMVENSNKDEKASEINESKFGPGTPDRERKYQRNSDETYIFFDEVDILGEKEIIDGKSGLESEGENKSEQGSDADEFVDARNTIESESESEVDGLPKPILEHYFGDISTYCSEDANSDNNDESEGIRYRQMAADPDHGNSLDESCSGSYFPEDTNVFCSLSDQVCGKTVSNDETFHKPRELFAVFSSSLDEEAFPDETILQEKYVAAHPLLAEDCANEKISYEEHVSSGLSLNDVVPAERILPEEHVANYPSLAEAVPHEKILPGESVAINPSFAEIVPHEEILPEKSLPKVSVSAEAVPDDMTTAEEPDAAYPPCPNIVQVKKTSPEVLDTKNLPVPEAVSQEQMSLEEFVGIYPCLAETVPDELFLTEGPEEPVTACMSSSKVMPTEKLLPEKPLEALHILSELPEEKILQEKTVDSTHPPCARAASPEENISPEVLDSSNLSVVEAVPQELIGLEEFVGGDPCLAKAAPDERVLSEEPVTTCLSLTKTVAVEKALQEERLETYPSLSELPEEKISREETDDATHPSKDVSDEKISPEVSGHTNFFLEESLPQKQISLEEFVGIDPCLADAVLDERFLPEEPVTTCPSLKETVTVELVLPEKPLEVSSSFAELLGEKILHKEADDVSHPSISQAVTDEKISPEVLDSTSLPVAAALPQEQTLLGEFVSTDPCSPEEPVTICLPLTKPVPSEEVLPEEPLEAYASLEKSPNDEILQEKSDDGTHPNSAEAESDENVLPEVLDSENLSVVEAIPQENITVEEFVGIDPCFSESVPDERVFPEESVATFMPLTKDGPIKKILAEEPLEVFPSLEELPEEKISQEEEPDDATHPSFLEAAGDEKISPLECLRSICSALEESLGHEEASHEEFVTTNPFLESAVSDVSSSPDEPDVTYEFSTEAVSMEKNLPEEPLPTYPSLAEAVPDESISLEESDATCPPSEEVVFDEKVSGSEALGYTTEVGPHSLEGFVASDMSLAEAGSYEKLPGSETPGSTSETGPQNKTFPDEPIDMYLSLAEPVPEENVLPKKPAAAYLDLAEGIPDQQVFLDDAAFLSFAEAIFDQKFSPEIPDSAYHSLGEPEMPVAPRSLVTGLPAKSMSVKESLDAYDKPYTESDVSLNQKSGSLESKSADRTIPPSDDTVTISPDSQGTLSNGTIVESVSIWSNGGLLGLAPSKPPVFAEPNSVSQRIQNDSCENSVLATKNQELSSRSVEDTEKGSLPLVVSDPMSRQQNRMLSHSNGSCSHLQSKATSFKVFGLSHRLLMAGFRGDTSSTCKFESIPTTSYDTEVAAIEDKAQQTPHGSSFEEQSDYESSLLGSPTSSPPVEHMRISFNAKDASSVSKLKLRIPCQPQSKGENADMFPSFQLVPEASNSDDDDDDNSYRFFQPSPCVSDNCLSDSELWESDESPRKTVLSSKQAGERSTQWEEMGSFSGSVLDLPSFDSLDHQSTSSRLEVEEEQVVEHKPSVSEIIRDWPPNQPKNSPSKHTQNQSVGL